MVLDTHIWFWFNDGDPRLPREVGKRITALGQNCLLSSVSIWEAMLLLEKGRLRSPYSPRETITRWLEGNPFTIVPVDTEIAIHSRLLAFGHEDPADRFIGATAFVRGVPLATVDRSLVRLSWLDTLSE